MKKNLLLLLFTLISIIANAQNYQWAKSIGTAGTDNGWNMAFDGSGNCYVTGIFSGTADFDPGPGTAILSSVGGVDIFFAKYDANGNYIWAKNIGSTGDDWSMSIAVDGSGNCYISGQFNGTADFDPGPGSANLTIVGTWDVFFAKYSTNGNYIWAKSIGSNGWDNAYSIAPDALGNCYVTGYFGGTADFDPGVGTSSLGSAGGHDIFFAKYDANGNYLWAKSIGSAGQDYGYGISVDISGNCYITGGFAGTADFDPGIGVVNLAPVGSSDIFIAKYDAGGNYLWAERMGGLGGSSLGRGIAVDITGNCFITGGYFGTADFDYGVGTANLTSLGGADIFFAKYDANGNYMFAKSIGSTVDDYGVGITVDVLGNSYITGRYSNTADFDPGVGTVNLSSVGGEDIFFARYDVSGSYAWAKNIGSTGNDRGSGIAVDNAGNCYLTGYFAGTADFDPGVGTANLSTLGGQDVFFAKYWQTGFPPKANFVASDSTICINACINFTDITTGLPISWSWTFSGSLTPTSNLQNPVNICYPSAGVYPVTLIATNISGADTITHNIVVSALPVVTLNTFIDTCISVSPFPMFGGSPLGGTYSGTGVSGGIFNPSIAGAGTFLITYTYTDINECIGTATQNVVVNPLPTVTASAVNPSLCYGQCTNLNGGGASNYLWMPGSLSGTTVSVCPTSPTTYTVTGTSTAGCSSSATVSVAVNPTPTVTANSSLLELCEGQCTSLNGLGAYSYSWMPGSLSGTTINVCPTSTTIYSVTGTTTFGCTGTTTITVTVNTLPPVTAIPSSPLICSGECTNLNGGGANNYSWMPGSMNGAIVNVCPTTTTVYTVTGISTSGCTATTTTTITVNPNPTISATAVWDTLCLGNCTYVFASGANVYSWMPGSLTGGTVLVCPTSTTVYTVTGIGTNGCVGTETLQVFVDSCTLVNDLNFDSEFTVYPNPSTDFININFSEAATSVENISIYSLDGKLIYFENLERSNKQYARKVTITSFSKGLYFVKLMTDKGVAVRKFVKE